MSDEDNTVEDAPEATDVEQVPVDDESVDQRDDLDTGESFDAQEVLRKIRKQNSELKSLRARAKDAEQKANQSTEEKDRELSSLRVELLRTKVGAKTGLPEQIVERLKGDTEEEMLADAESFLEIVSPKRPPSQKPAEALRGGGRPAEEPEETDLSKIAARMFDR